MLRTTIRPFAAIRLLAPVALLILAGAGTAQAQAGTGHLEIFGGYYSPDSDFLDDEVTFGLRTGYQFNDQWGYLFQVGRYTTDHEFPAGSEVVNGQGEVIGVTLEDQIGLDLWVLDFSIAWYQRAGNQEGLNVFFGPGIAFTDLDSSAFAEDFDFVEDDSLTLHAGIGWNFMVSDQLKVRPDVRARWFDSGNSPVDIEATVAIGWVFE